MNTMSNIISIAHEVPQNPLEDLISRMDAERIGLTKEATNEEAYFKQQPVETTLRFERNRYKVLDSLKKLVDYLWREYNLPTEGIVEYGSGATGFYDANLRPGFVPHWLQMEINPHAVAENKRRNPNTRVEEGSYKKISFRNLSMVTGLSSWDTSSDLRNDLKQVTEALRQGGFFFHIQDVRPGMECISNYLERVYGKRPEYGFAVTIPDQAEREVFGVLIEGRKVTTPDIFRDAMSHAIANQSDLELVLNDYITLFESLPNANDIRGTYKIKPLQKLFEFYFLNFYGIYARTKNGDEQDLRETTLLVTLARKR